MYHKWQSYAVWFLRYEGWRTEFFVILDNFLPYYHPLTTQKIKIFKNWKKKMPEDIIILHMCTIIINDNHMMYGSWDMARDARSYFSFSAIFGAFALLTAQKIKIKVTHIPENFCQINIFPSHVWKRYHHLFDWCLKMKISEF